MLGYPITGATVNFTANQSFVSIKPNPTTTDSNGNAFSYASSTQTGNVKITAAFAGSSANVIINFTPPVYVTFETTPMQSTTAPVLTVDGVSYTYQQLPLTIAYNINSKHSYSFASPISGATSTRYAYSSISGCGVSTQSGNFTAISNCTMLATYKTQYYLNMQANPNTAGTVSPASNWFDASKIVGISAASSSMYFFKNWTGIGIGNYTGKTEFSWYSQEPLSKFVFIYIVPQSLGDEVLSYFSNLYNRYSVLLYVLLAILVVGVVAYLYFKVVRV